MDSYHVALFCYENLFGRRALTSSLKVWYPNLHNIIRIIKGIYESNLD